MPCLSCCRKPPDNGGQGPGRPQPRPISLQSLPSHHLDSRSCSTPPGRATQLMTKFESVPRSDAIVSAVPLEPSYKGPIDLEQLVVDDSDGDEDQVPLGKRASVTWGAVRNRLTRHISLESSLKKEPPSLTGRSREEIERRAELKRLMHKRIQDELSCDESNPKPLADSRKANRKPSSSNLDQPRVGPRDTIEFVVKEKDHRNPSIAESTQKRADVKSGDERVSPDAATLLSPELHAVEHPQGQTNTLSRHERLLGGNGVSRTMGSSHVNHQTTQGSLRLIDESLAQPPAGCLVPGEQEKSDSHDSQSWETHSVLAIWLRSQGIRSREPSFARLEAIEADITGPGVSQVPSEARESSHEPFGGNVSASVDSIVSEQVKRLAKKQLSDLPKVPGNSPTPKLSTDVGKREPLSNEEDSHQQTFALSPSQDLAQSYAVAMAFDSGEDASSSVYPSVMPSAQASSLASQANILYNLNNRDLQSVHLTSLPWAVVGNGREPQPLAGKTSTSQTERDTIFKQVESRNQDREPQTSPLTLDAVSIAPTETASFQQREAELMTIKKRFGDVLLRRKSPTPVLSRFREEFNQPSRPTSRRGTLMAKVHRSFERRSKTLSESMDDSVAAALLKTNVGDQSSLVNGLINTGSVPSPQQRHASSTTWKSRLPIARHRLDSLGDSKGPHLPVSDHLIARVSDTRFSVPVSKPNDRAVTSPARSTSRKNTITLDKSEKSKTPEVRSSPISGGHRSGEQTSSLLRQASSTILYTTQSKLACFPPSIEHGRRSPAAYGRDSVHTHSLAVDAVGSSSSQLSRVRVQSPCSSTLSSSRSAKLGHRVMSGLSKILPFMSQESNSTDEKDISPKANIHTTHFTPITADMASSPVNYRRPPDTASVIRHSVSPSRGTGSTISIGSDSESPVYEVVEGGAVVTIQRISARGSSPDLQNPRQSSSVVLTDIFLTPLSQSLALKSTEGLTPYGSRSITCPVLYGPPFKKATAGCLPKSHSCPGSIAQGAVDFRIDNRSPSRSTTEEHGSVYSKL